MRYIAMSPFLRVWYFIYIYDIYINIYIYILQTVFKCWILFSRCHSLRYNLKCIRPFATYVRPICILSLTASIKVFVVHFKNVDQIPELDVLMWRNSSWIWVVSIYHIIRYCYYQISNGLNYWFNMIMFCRCMMHMCPLCSYKYWMSRPL